MSRVSTSKTYARPLITCTRNILSLLAAPPAPTAELLMAKKTSKQNKQTSEKNNKIDVNMQSATVQRKI